MRPFSSKVCFLDSRSFASAGADAWSRSLGMTVSEGAGSEAGESPASTRAKSKAAAEGGRAT